jgi:hypothetical protein
MPSYTPPDFASVQGETASLPQATRRHLENAFRHSFSGVRVHPESSRVTGSVQAVTEGRDIHFARARYQPGTARGDWLIGHELAHVVQQSGRQTRNKNPDYSQFASRKARQATILRRAPASRSSAPPHIGTDQPQLRIGASFEQVRIQRSHTSELFRRPTSGSVAALDAHQAPSIMRAPQDNIEQSDRGASPDKGMEIKGTENASQENWGLCIRTPLPPGQVRFSGSAKALKDFAVMPEEAQWSQRLAASGKWKDLRCRRILVEASSRCVVQDSQPLHDRCESRQRRVLGLIVL